MKQKLASADRAHNSVVVANGRGRGEMFAVDLPARYRAPAGLARSRLQTCSS